MQTDLRSTLLFRLLTIVAVLLLAVRVGAQNAPEGNTTEATALVSTFTYQGYLEQNAIPVTATCDFQFSLYDALAGGVQIGSTLTRTNIVVSGGIFTVQLDFGATAFNGQDRYLAISARCPAGTGSYTPLTPRQPITPAPYSMYAIRSAWAGLVGIPEGFADGIDNTGLDWALLGNAGTNPAANFLGTTDNQPLELRVNNTRVMRYEPNVTSPNIIGGYSGNSITAGVVGGTIGGGGLASSTNIVTDDYGTVAGGRDNQAGDGAGTTADRLYSTVGGGFSNTASGQTATIAGGSANNASGQQATIGGGIAHIASGLRSTIGGGASNDATAQGATVDGGEDNLASGTFAVVGGGSDNIAGGPFSVIGGGSNNEALGQFATIGGGTSNQTFDDYSTIGGGDDNQAGNNAGTTADRAYATVSGGTTNIASGAYSTIGGGRLNTVSDADSVVAGGAGNTVSAPFGTVGGGGMTTEGNTATGNRVTDRYGTVSGGGSNQAGNAAGTTVDSQYATVSGGVNNTASGAESTVGGGTGNTASGEAASVAGGDTNTASGTYAVVGGGQNNSATTQGATVGGGFSNTASALYSTVPGGLSNTAGGIYSFAAGRRAIADDAGAFVWGDNTNADVNSPTSNSFTLRASGGIFLYTNATLTAGVQVAAGGSSWSVISDRSMKENLEQVDAEAVLDALVAIPVSTWNYISQDETIRHMGVMAQDFYAAFGVGEDDRHITTIDADGVAFAAIQGLYNVVQEQNAQLVDQEEAIAALQAHNTQLEARLSALEGLVQPETGTLLPWALLTLACGISLRLPKILGALNQRQQTGDLG
jgi:trimeric autotransporter adhesin